MSPGGTTVILEHTKSVILEHRWNRSFWNTKRSFSNTEPSPLYQFQSTLTLLGQTYKMCLDSCGQSGTPVTEQDMRTPVIQHLRCQLPKKRRPSDFNFSKLRRYWTQHSLLDSKRNIFLLCSLSCGDSIYDTETKVHNLNLESTLVCWYCTASCHTSILDRTWSLLSHVAGIYIYICLEISLREHRHNRNIPGKCMYHSKKRVPLSVKQDSHAPSNSKLRTWRLRQNNGINQNHGKGAGMETIETA